MYYLFNDFNLTALVLSRFGSMVMLGHRGDRDNVQMRNPKPNITN